MKKSILILIYFVAISFYAQDHRIPLDTTVVTTNSVVIKGKTVPYKATTGMQPVWDDKGTITASLYYTYYKRTDVKTMKIDQLLCLLMVDLALLLFGCILRILDQKF